MLRASSILTGELSTTSRVATLLGGDESWTVDWGQGRGIECCSTWRNASTSLTKVSGAMGLAIYPSNPAANILSWSPTMTSWTPRMTVLSKSLVAIALPGESGARLRTPSDTDYTLGHSRKCTVECRLLPNPSAFH